MIGGFTCVVARRLGWAAVQRCRRDTVTSGAFCREMGCARCFLPFGYIVVQINKVQR